MDPALPTVSVIVPVHNAERTLPRLMASLRAQSYPRERVEILLVDNRSTDRSAEVMRGYADARALSQADRQGPAATRNEGIRASHGETLAFIDADCRAHPEWLSRGIGALQEKGLDRVAGRVEFVLPPRPNIYEIYDSTVNFRQTDFLSAGWCGTGNLFARRGVFDEVGLFDPELISHEDSEWGLRATRAGKASATRRRPWCTIARGRACGPSSASGSARNTAPRRCGAGMACSRCTCGRRRRTIAPSSARGERFRRRSGRIPASA